MATSHQSILQKYPSLRKLEDQGDDACEWNDGREQQLLQYIKRHADLPAFQADPSKMLAAIDEFSSQHDFLISIGSDKRRVIADVIAEEKPLTVVELGGYLGYSALFFADQMRRCLPSTSSYKILSLELDPSFALIAQELISIAGLSDRIEVITGAAADSLRLMHAERQLKSIDMLLIDHGEGGIHLYKDDLQLCEELGLLQPGACILADNVLRPGAPDYREYVRNHPSYESRALKCLIIPGEFEDEIELSKVKAV